MKNNKLDLSIFSESLLTHSQLLTLLSSTFTLASRHCRLLCEQNKLESSANKWKSRSGADLLKSFIYKRNNNGPRTEPCGTPQVIGFRSDVTLPMDTSCFLLER